MKFNISSKAIFLLFAVFTSTTVFAQDTPTSISEKFFANYEKEGAKVALDTLYKTNAWMDRNKDAVNQLVKKLEGLDDDFVGKYYGYELLLEKKLSNSYVLRSYLVKFDRQPIRFTFQFYRPNDHWKIFSFEFDGEIDEEVEQAAKLFYMNMGF